MNYYNKKEYIQRDKYYLFFNAVKDEKLFDLVIIEQRKQEKIMKTDY